MRHRDAAGRGIVLALALALACLAQTAQGQVVQFAGEGAKRLLVRTSNETWWFSTRMTTVTSVNVEVPASMNEAVLFVRFSAESRCEGGDECVARILVDGVQTTPTPFFDDGYADTWSSISLERASAPLSSGVHTVTVQMATHFSFYSKLDSWQLTIETWKVS